MVCSLEQYCFLLYFFECLTSWIFRHTMIYTYKYICMYIRVQRYMTVQLKCVLLLYNVREHIAILDVLGDLLKTLNGVNFHVR